MKADGSWPSGPLAASWVMTPVHLTFLHNRGPEQSGPISSSGQTFPRRGSAIKTGPNLNPPLSATPSEALSLWPRPEPTVCGYTLSHRVLGAKKNETQRTRQKQPGVTGSSRWSSREAGRSHQRQGWTRLTRNVRNL